jgi:hypothetical protein
VNHCHPQVYQSSGTFIDWMITLCSVCVGVARATAQLNAWPPPIGFIGDLNSMVSASLSSIAAVYSTAVVSPSSRSSMLTDSQMFPSFHRIISSNHQHARAVMDILLSFEWRCAIILSSDDEYGESLSHELLNVASSLPLSTLFIIERLVTFANSSSSSDMDSILNNMLSHNCRIVVVTAPVSSHSLTSPCRSLVAHLLAIVVVGCFSICFIISI